MARLTCVSQRKPEMSVLRCLNILLETGSLMSFPHKSARLARVSPRICLSPLPPLITMSIFSGI